MEEFFSNFGIIKIIATAGIGLSIIVSLIICCSLCRIRRERVALLQPSLDEIIINNDAPNQVRVVDNNSENMEPFRAIINSPLISEVERPQPLQMSTEPSGARPNSSYLKKLADKTDKTKSMFRPSSRYLAKYLLPRRSNGNMDISV